MVLVIGKTVLAHTHTDTHYILVMETHVWPCVCVCICVYRPKDIIHKVVLFSLVHICTVNVYVMYNYNSLIRSKCQKCHSWWSHHPYFFILFLFLKNTSYWRSLWFWWFITVIIIIIATTTITAMWKRVDEETILMRSNISNSHISLRKQKMLLLNSWLVQTYL